MKTAGIICEYNPFHLGHMGHIEKTRQALGDDTAVVCVMSGNFVQRGDIAVFNKHTRSKTAIFGGADLVIELPVPYVLQSAEGFAGAGVYLLDALGICDHLSFGSESGQLDDLREAAEMITTDKAHEMTKQWLDKGVTYAAAQQKAATEQMGKKAEIFSAPNNVLGIEYIKALKKYNSRMQPVTVQRTGGDHDSDTGFSASALRKELFNEVIPASLMPDSVTAIYKDEIDSGRGPVFLKHMELAVLSRLRAIDDFSDISGVSEGLDQRFKRFTSTEPSIGMILDKIKTKRYTMSRLRRVLMCSVLGIKKEHVKTHPPYIRVLAMNNKGKALLGKSRKISKLPIITKPASVNRLNENSVKLFTLESMSTDFYVLSYRDECNRTGGQEWRHSPAIIDQIL